MADLLSREPGATATILDVLESGCTERGADPAAVLRLRELIARYYDKLHPVMARTPPLLVDFNAYPDRKTGTIRVTLQMDDGSKADFLATRDDVRELLDTLRWALNALAAKEEDDESEAEAKQTVTLHTIKDVLNTLFRAEPPGSGESGNTITTI